MTENTACSADANELYFEVEKEENMKDRESYMKQENENLLYETTEGETVPNPIYDRFVCLLFIFPEKTPKTPSFISFNLVLRNLSC